MVMPFLGHIDDPEFGSVGELLEFGDQIFEVSALSYTSVR